MGVAEGTAVDMRNLAFWVDILAHMNTLNTKLQGKGQLVTDLRNHINGFTNKLEDWMVDINEDKLHFPMLKEYLDEQEEIDDGTLLYQEFLGKVSAEYSAIFQEFTAVHELIKFVDSPLTADRHGAWRRYRQSFQAR